MLGVLQTWTRDLRYHPHIHYLVPAIGLAADGRFCRPRNPAFLIPVQALAVLFRAKLRAALRQTTYGSEISPALWTRPWVVDCRPVGSGAVALKYLAPYIFRVALSNNRIVQLVDDRVTFRYVDGATHRPKTCTLPALAFLHRFLQHVLPRGFVKVRYYGLFSRCQRAQLAQLRAQLALVAGTSTSAGDAVGQAAVLGVVVPIRPAADRCPVCGQIMQARVLVPQRSRGPPDGHDARPVTGGPNRGIRRSPAGSCCATISWGEEAAAAAGRIAGWLGVVRPTAGRAEVEDEPARGQRSANSGDPRAGPRLNTKGDLVARRPRSTMIDAAAARRINPYSSLPIYHPSCHLSLTPLCAMISITARRGKAMTELITEVVNGEPYQYYPLGEHVVRAVGVCGGRPTFKYTRIEITGTLDRLAVGESLEAIVAGYRGKVSREAVMEAVQIVTDGFLKTLPALESA